MISNQNTDIGTTCWAALSSAPHWVSTATSLLGGAGGPCYCAPVALIEPHDHWTLVKSWLLSTPSDTSSAGGERNFSLLTARWPSQTVLGGCWLPPGNTVLRRHLKPHLDSKGETHIIFSNSIRAWEGGVGPICSVVFRCSRKVIVWKFSDLVKCPFPIFWLGKIGFCQGLVLAPLGTGFFSSKPKI